MLYCRPAKDGSESRFRRREGQVCVGPGRVESPPAPRTSCVQVTAVGASGGGGAALVPASLRSRQQLRLRGQAPFSSKCCRRLLSAGRQRAQGRGAISRGHEN